MTISTENFVKAIYRQSKISGADTRLSALAELLKISNAAVTDMARKLAVKKLIIYTKYKPLTLTAAGNELALTVIRKHRLWESFLYQTLNLSLHEIHREAEQLEHLTSDFLADKIENFLGKPTIDPHGDPIPTYNGKIEVDNSQLMLSEAKAGYLYEISRLFSSEKDFFDFCAANTITMGSTLWVEKQYDVKKMTEIKINQNTILLNKDFTNIIYVKQII
jgi:DtxR family Mn-dependent transcriptional regulator